jgi:hypothetical protein
MVSPSASAAFEVDHQLEPGRLLDGKIGRLCSLENPIHVFSGAPLGVIPARLYAIRPPRSRT